MAKDEHGNTDTIDWSAITPTQVEQLKPSKTIEDVPAPIRQWIDDAFKSGVIGQVTLPTAVAAKVFMREARDYGYLHNPRLTVRLTQQKDDVSVRFSVREYKAREETPASAAKGRK